MLPFLLLAVFAWRACALPVISEFVATNDSGLADEDGDTSDWIEIFNPDSTNVNMGGWCLTCI